jgi:hypothetical protein
MPIGDVRRVSDVPEAHQDWLWPDRVPIGHVTTIVGPRGAAKSYLVAEIAARVSIGDPWPDQPRMRQEPGEALIITAEDDVARVIAPRLRACGADTEKVHVLDCRREDGGVAEVAFDRIEAIARELPGLRLIVIDPIAEVLGTRNDRRLPEIRVLLNQLARLAERRGIAVVLVNATDKVSAGRTWRYGVDVLPFLDAGARAAWTLEPDPAEAGRFLWLGARANLAGPRQGLAFTIDRGSGKVCWDPEPVELRAEDLRPNQPRITKAARAADWLLDALADGPRTAVDVANDAALAGIARGALHEAKSRLGVLSEKQTGSANGGWTWRLPDAAHEMGESAVMTFVKRLAADLRASAEEDLRAMQEEGEANRGDSAQQSGGTTTKDTNYTKVFRLSERAVPSKQSRPSYEHIER